MKLRLALALSLSGLPAMAVAQEAVLIRDVAVFDGERSLGKRSVLIEGGKIANPDFKGKLKAGIQIVDGKGKTLFPGMIDAHVHAFGDNETPLLFGVTTQLDMFMPPQMNADVKVKSKNGGNRLVSDLFSAGYLATAPKGHGTQYGTPVPTLTKPEEADAWVAARAAEGSDFIKIVNEPGSSFGQKIPTLDSATIKALIVAAHRRGKLAVVHVQNYDAAIDALSSGADGLAHLFSDKAGDAAFVKLAKEKGAFVTPTMTVFESFAGRAGSLPLLGVPAFKGLLDQRSQDAVKMSIGKDRSAQLYAMMKTSISGLVAAGVPILAGTDSGNPGTSFGISLHRELELLVQSGLTPSQALTAATAAPAKAYRLADRGRIAKGLIADLVLVEGDPTKDIRATRNIVGVWKGGQSALPLREARRAALASAAAAPKGAALELPVDGRIAAFSEEGGKVKMAAPVGLGWSTTSDSMMGGSSTVKVALGGAAPNGQKALLITGDVKQGAFAQWAGIGYMPGKAQFQPTNLSNANALKFWTRGTGGGFGVMAFSEKSGQMPITRTFAATKDWAEVTVKFSDLNGFDPVTATLLTINALQPGAFSLEIADVRLVKE